MISTEVIAEYMKGSHCDQTAPQVCINPDLCCAHCSICTEDNLCSAKSKGEKACMFLEDKIWSNCSDWVSALEDFNGNQ